MRNAREEICKRMTNSLAAGDTNAELFAIYRGEKTKEAVFGELLGRLSAFDDEVGTQTELSKQTTEAIQAGMVEFNSVKSGASQDTSALEFFSSIDEGLKAFNDNLNLLSNGAQFYKQMHQYLTSLQVFITDFVQSRTLERQELVNQINGGGSGAPAPGGPSAPAPGFLGTPYQPPRYQ